MSEKYEGVFENWEIGVTKNIVSRFQNKFPLLKREGFDDLVSECLIFWMEKRGACDVESKGNPKCYMAKAIKRYLRDIKDRVYSIKRKLTYESQSLEEYFEDEDSERPRKKFEPVVLENLPLKVDISAVVETLTSDQKMIYRLVYEDGMSPLQASKRLKTYPKHVYREIDRIRQLFEAKGLKEYLK